MAPVKRLDGHCLNCGRKCRPYQRVCTVACGNELAHRILDAVPGVLQLLPPGDRSKWRDYKTPQLQLEEKP